MFHFRRLLAVFSLLVLLSSCATGAYNLKEGIGSFKIQDYRRAFIRLLPEANKGQPDAQYAVGYMYYYGEGVTEDKQKALYWIKCAADAGQPDAVMAMKILYSDVK